MMTCKDCLHVEVCAYIKPDLPICSDFADRTRYVMREKGEWEGTNCSRCGGSYMDYADADSYPAIGEPKPDFCPNCGSDMRNRRQTKCNEKGAIIERECSEKQNSQPQ